MKLNNIVLYLIAFIAGLAGLASFARPAYAQSCTTQYGGTTTCVSTDLTIDKKVRDPINLNVFKENIVDGDTPYAPGAIVEYQLIVTNSSGQTFQTVTVSDVLPAQLDFYSGPGTYNAATRTLTYPITNLQSGTSNVQRVAATVKPASAFTSGQTKFCEIVNTARVSAEGRSDDDTAALCVKTDILGATTLPVAGYNDLILLLPFAGMGLGGLALLRKRG